MCYQRHNEYFDHHVIIFLQETRVEIRVEAFNALVCCLGISVVHTCAHQRFEIFYNNEFRMKSKIENYVDVIVRENFRLYGNIVLLKDWHWSFYIILGSMEMESGKSAFIMCNFHEKFIQYDFSLTDVKAIHFFHVHFSWICFFRLLLGLLET